MTFTHEHQLGFKRADFLFDNRSIVCEIKALETDTAPKFIAFLKQEGFDLPPGDYSIQELFATRPNGRDLFARATRLVATAVADGLAEANRQIGDTKKLLGISAADGLVVILNGMVEVLGPQLVIKRCLERLEKLADDGSSYHANVTLILYFSEKHLRETGAGDAAVAFPIPNERVTPFHDLNALSTQFVEGWANFNGRWYDEQAWDLGLRRREGPVMLISQAVARRFVLLASGLAVYAAVITSASIVLGDPFVGWGSVVDVAIFVGLAYGVYRGSRTCAVLLFVYHMVNRVSMYFLTGGLGPLLGVAPLTYAVVFFLGILGTFTNHRIDAEGGRPAKAC